jgi:hypothetical protein
VPTRHCGSVGCFHLIVDPWAFPSTHGDALISVLMFPAGTGLGAIDILTGTAVVYTGRRGYTMIRTVEAVIDEDGNVRLLEAVRPSTARRALVTILEESPATSVSESALLSEEALAQDWNRPEEDEAWSHIQPEQ